MQLSKRLQCISQMIKPCRCLCDIGTDHAHIPIDAVSRGIAVSAIASDVRKGPCQMAAKNIQAHRLDERITVRLGSGFQTIRAGECDCAVIAGMGGNLMLQLLQEAGKIPETLQQLVIQPQNALERVRKFFYEQGYAVQQEKLVYEEGKFYTILSVAYTGAKQSKEPVFYYIGEYLLMQKDPLLLPYLEKEIRRLEKILSQTELEEARWLKTEYEKIKEKIVYD